MGLVRALLALIRLIDFTLVSARGSICILSLRSILVLVNINLFLPGWQFR